MKKLLFISAVVLTSCSLPTEQDKAHWRRMDSIASVAFPKTDSQKPITENKKQEVKSDPDDAEKVIDKSYKLGDLAYKVEKYRFKKYIGGLLTLKKADGVFLILSVTVTNESKQQVMIDDSNFKLKDAQGNIYDYSPDAAASIELSDFPGETFMGTTINPKISKTGKVVFEVPEKTNYDLIITMFTDDLEEKSAVIKLTK